MTTGVAADLAPDGDLWGLVRQGSVPAFEAVVRRHQSAVAAVAYSVCGDLALSEDVAQETFWAAWRGRSSLDEPGRLRAWLCGIARNLGKDARRKASRAAGPLGDASDPPTGAPGPDEDAVSREEEALVWKSLESVPEAYREPLILFYRESQSVADVAAALDLSEDAVKQRLSRGRGMLRERMAAVVEDGLRRSRPGRAFTAAVITGLAQEAGAKAAAAGFGAAKALAGAGLKGGAVASLLGPLIGLFGGWLGVWLPAELARTRGERDHLRRHGRRLILASLAFTALMFAAPVVLSGRLRPAYWPVWGVSFAAFMAYVLFATVRASRRMKRVRDEGGPGAEPNDSALRVGADALASRFRGRVYRSRTTFLGLPLIDVNVSDPATGRGPSGTGRKVARGWVAIGDEARGVLLAVGSGKAVGLVALGGQAFGVLSLGGGAVGLIAVGGLAVGVVAFGGLGLGVFAFGGLAAGWQAGGGGAIAWEAACGGGAYARHAASGGAAFARDFAVGGGGWARHFNDDAARAVLAGYPLKRGMDWYAANVSWVMAAVVALSLLVPGLLFPLLYRRERAGGG